MADYKTVAIHPETHRRAKIMAAQLGKPLVQVVTELLEEWMERQEEMRRDGDTTIGDTGLADPD